MKIPNIKPEGKTISQVLYDMDLFTTALYKLSNSDLDSDDVVELQGNIQDLQDWLYDLYKAYNDHIKYLDGFVEKMKEFLEDEEEYSTNKTNDIKEVLKEIRGY